MSGFLRVPVERLEPDTLAALLEEFATRDGTDYGERETPLDERVAQLREQLTASELHLMYHPSTESWDLVSSDDAQRLSAIDQDSQEA